LNAVEIKKDIYWVGAIDWSLRNFHGYTTQRGSTYNAYLIIDEKITLVDTVKEAFAPELLARVSRIIDPAKIDYLVANHVEMDHSGSIPEIMKIAPNATIVASAPHGVNGLKAHFGEYKFQGVKAGDSLSLGANTLHFVTTPMLHWPDNMVSYCPEQKLLFSNDAFGQHYASSVRFDDEAPLADLLAEAKKYYANIVMPYSTQAAGAHKAVSGLDIDTICPSHGIIWRSHIPEILEKYRSWSSIETDGSAVVVFDSMWHSTETIAKTIAEAFQAAAVPVKFYDLKQSHISDIMDEILTADYILVGSPTLNNNLLPTVSAFLTYMKGLAPKNRKALAFGSYGWGGQSIGQVEEQLLACGFTLISDSIRIKYRPTPEQLDSITSTILDAVAKK